ncbi:unnamed protein product [Didymodactylos carnosus]|uniref:(d)CMP kinase n=1 Tax=Didymodactylos carnosus TaxID=1234261 RepID=A0A8S2CU49_9BILA|nr:unnamed protein product [Didymodactylos carnosus]CAF3587260.1 unnamed protein product [Didymodactylos carnosus]
MYRAYALKAVEQNIELTDEHQLVDLAQNTNIQLYSDGRVELDGKDVTSQIRTPLISNVASVVSTYKIIREKAVASQKKMAADHNVIMDGRDIGTVVLPEADIKLYLTASVDVRVNRRLAELRKTGVEIDEQQIRQQVIERDYRDVTRAESPLVRALDAHEINTDELSIDQIVTITKQMIANKRKVV